MKIQHLRFLAAVVEYGGVIKAAERLHLSQPSVSAGLKALEQTLGRPLFDRSIPANRPLRLTPAGRRFYRHAREILQQCDAARADFLGEAEDLRRIRVGVLNTLPHEAIAALVQAVAKQAPNVRLEVWEASAERVAGWLAQARIDFGWTNVSDLAANARVLWREPLVAVVAPDHPLAQTSGPISVRDLGAHPFVHRSTCELDAVGRAQLKAAGVTLRVTVRAEREELVFRLIRNGKGMTLAPRCLVPDDLVAVPVSGLGVARTIGLEWREGLDPMLPGLLADAMEDVVSLMPVSAETGRQSKRAG